MTDPVGNMPKRFMVSCNGRSGSTFLTLALNGLPDVASDFEFQWKPTFQSIANDHKVIPSRFTLISVMLDLAFANARKPVIGSKLVFSPRRYGCLEIRDLLLTFDKDIRIVHLHRNAVEVLTSYMKKSKKLNLDPAKAGDSQIALAAQIQNTEEEDSVQEPMTAANMNQVILLMFQIKMIERFLSIFRKHCTAYFFLDYAQITDQWDDLCTFLGSSATADQRRDALKNCPVLRNSSKPLNETYTNAAEITAVAHAMDRYRGAACLLGLFNFYGVAGAGRLASLAVWTARNWINRLMIRRRFRLLFLRP